MQKFLLIFVVSIAACASGPKYRISDEAIAKYSVDEKAGITAGQNEVGTAQEELTHAQVKQTETKRDYELSGQSLHAAKLHERAAQAKYDWLLAKYEADERLLQTHKSKLLAMEAKVELEKAKLIAQKGDKPTKDFTLVNYESQAANDTKKFTDDKIVSEKAKLKADKLEAKYNDASKAYEEVSNK